MGLDIYVMPLWRFKAGDFSTPLEDFLGRSVKTVTPDGLETRPARSAWYRRLWPWKQSVDLAADDDSHRAVDSVTEAITRAEVEAIRRAVAEANGTEVTWTDDGEMVFSTQSHGIESLRAYAKWLDCRDRFPTFEKPAEGNFYNHPVFGEDIADLSCPHLVEHDCYSGYFLPVDFERTVEVEPFLIAGKWASSKPVGSAPRLLRELDILQALLRVPEEYDFPKDDPLLDVKAAYIQLRGAVSASLAHGLPIIFYG